MRLRVLPILVALLAAVVPLAWGASNADVGTVAAKRSPLSKSPDLWATINVCDTAAHPDTIGIRGSMPALRHKATLYMRFRVEYLSMQTDGKWRDVTDNADSGWKRVGRVRNRVVEAGQNFTFEPPAAGGAHRLRGAVTFKWVRGGKTVHRRSRHTEAGHRTTAGADPDGYSAAVCDIT